MFILPFYDKRLYMLINYIFTIKYIQVCYVNFRNELALKIDYNIYENYLF